MQYKNTLKFFITLICSLAIVNAHAQTPLTITYVSDVNPTTCNSTDGSITISGLTADSIYTVNYTEDGTVETATDTAGATGNVTILGLPAGAYTNISVSASGGVTSDTLAGPYTLAANPITITYVSSVQPTTCNSTDGSITISGLITGSSYTVNYTDDGTAATATVTADASGDVTIPSLTAGVYTNISVTIAGCSSDTLAGPYTLAAPPITIAYVSSVQPTTCNSTDGAIKINGLTIDSVYTVNYTKDGTAATVTDTADATGNVTILGLTAGVYANISVTISGCTSDTLTGPYTLAAPPIIIAYVSSVQPTTCNSTDGAIKISVLTIDSVYTVNYTKDGTAATATDTADASGDITILSLTAGVYTNISVTISGCSSDTLAGPYTLAAPPIIITYVSSVQPTTCNSTDGAIKISGLTADSVYTVNYTKDGTAATATDTADASGDITISNLTVGVYTNISVTISGCSSDTLAGPDTLAAPPFTVTYSTSTNPTVCGAADGTIVLSGLTAGVAYTFNYTDTTTGTSHSVADTADASGNLTLTGLVAGVYSGFSVTTIGGCTSTVLSTYAVLTNPVITIAYLSDTNPTTCTSNDGSITFSGLVSGTAYTIHYIVTGLYSTSGVPASATVTADALGDITLTGLGADSYSAFSASTSASCTSDTVAGPYVLVNPIVPVIDSIGNNSPVCAGSALDLTSGTVPTATYSWTGPAGFTSTLQNPVIPTTVLADSGEYVLVMTVGGCPSAPDSTFATIKVTPATPVALSNSPVCIDSVLQLTATDATSGVTYSWSGPSGFTATVQDTAISPATTAAAGVYSLTATLNGCPSKVDSIVVFIGSDDTISSVTKSNPTTCGGTSGTITLNGLTAGTSYTVHYTKGVTADTITVVANASGQVIITGLSAGVYSAFNVAAGCLSNTIPGPDTLVDPAAPSITSISNSGPVCVGSALDLSCTSSATGTATYSWTGPGGFTSTMEYPIISSATAADSGLYHVTVTSSGCTSAPDSTNAIVNIIPASPVLSSNTPVCTGNAIDLTALESTAGVTFSWTGPAAFASTLQNPVIPSATLANAGTYSLTVTRSGCSAPVVTTPVVVKITPVIDTVKAVNPGCVSPLGTITLTGLTSGVSYTVNYQKGGVAQTATLVADASGDVVISSLSAATYSNFTVFDSGCTSASYPGPLVLINVMPPAAPKVTTNSPLCEGSTLMLNATDTSTGTITYSWTGPSSYTSTSSNPTIPDVVIANGGVYSVTATRDGCISSVMTASVTVNITPVITLDSYTQPTVCGATDGTVTFGGLVNGTSYTIKFTLDGTLTAASVYGNASGTGTINNLSPGNYVDFTATTTAGCVSNTVGPVTLINPPPPVAAISISKVSICQYDTVTAVYSGTPTPGGTYAWSFPTFGSTILSGSDGGPYVIRFDSVLTGEVVVTITTANKKCSSTDSVAIVVTPAPVAAFYIKPEICIADTMSVALVNTVVTDTGYAWNFGNATVVASNSHSSGPYKITWPDAGLHYVSVESINNLGCHSLVYTDTVLVHPNPDASIQPISGTPICIGDSILLEAKDTVQGYSYQWTPKQFFDISTGPTVYGKIALPGFVTLTVSSEFGCTASDSVAMQTMSCCGVYFPDAFSPNKDGTNDVFRPVTNGHHKFHLFRIDNRWGQTVFQSADEKGAWDGNFNGVPQDMGTYFYYAKYDCDGKTVETKGEVILVR